MTDTAATQIQERANRSHGHLYVPSVLEAATVLLKDLWATGERHGVPPEAWGWTTDLAEAALSTISSQHTLSPDPERTTAEVTQLQRALIAELKELGLAGTPGRQVAVERIPQTPRWGFAGDAQLAVGIWTNGGWDLVLDGVTRSPLHRIVAPATEDGAREVAALVHGIAHGDLPDPFRPRQ